VPKTCGAAIWNRLITRMRRTSLHSPAVLLMSKSCNLTSATDTCGFKPGVTTRPTGYFTKRYTVKLVELLLRFWEVLGSNLGSHTGWLMFLFGFPSRLVQDNNIRLVEFKRFWRWCPLSVNVGTNFADKRRSLGRYSSLADSDHGVFVFFSNDDIRNHLVCGLCPLPGILDN
jgi:hypothetical protein